MKRVSWLLFLCALFSVFASPGLADDRTAGDFTTLKTALAGANSGTTITITASIAVTGSIDGNGATLKRGSSFTNASMLACSTDNVAISNLIIDGDSVETTISKANTGGGGLFIDNAAVKVTGCTFKNNIIQTTNKLGYVGGGALYTLNAKSGTVVKDCVFEGNIVAQTKGGNENGGGAVYNLANTAAAEITFTSCDFTGNSGSSADILSKTTGLDATKEMQNTSGGAMSNVTGAASAKLTVTLERCVFTNNRASRYGGAIYNLTDEGDSVSVKITDSKFESNRLVGYENNGCLGGAVGTYAYAGNVDLTVENTLFKGNIAANTKINANGFGARGGALCSWTNYGASKTMTVTTSIVNCRFEANEANTGGAMANWGNSGTANVTELNNCTFINNKATVTDGVCGPNITNAVVYPRGGAVFTRGNADGKHQDQKGEASTTLYNCTFYNNESYSGGAVANTKGTSNSVTNTAETTLYNCTFVNNTLNSATDDNTYGLELYNDGGTLNVTNTVFYNPGKTLVTNAGSGTVTLKNSAYNGTPGINVTADTATKANAVFTNAASKTTAKATISGVEHTVFKLTESDTALTTGGTTGTNVPTTDQLGVTRSTTAPSIGAVEYVALKVSTTTLPAGTVGTAYKEELKAAFTPGQPDTELKWDLKSGSSLPDGLSLDISGVISGTPTTANTYSFTLTVAVSGDLYSVYSADQAFSLTINPKPDVSFDIGTVKITSTGGTPNLSLDITSADYSDKASDNASSNLTSVIEPGALAVNSADLSKVVVTVDPGDGSVEYLFLDTEDVTDDLLNDNKFTPSAEGTYKIIFKGTDDNDNEKYFAAEFKLSFIALIQKGDKAAVDATKSPEGSPDIQAPTTGTDDSGNITSVIPANLGIVSTLRSGEWTFPFEQLAQVIWAAQEALADFLEKGTRQNTTTTPDTSGKYKKLGAKLNKNVYPGTVFIIWLTPVRITGNVPQSVFSVKGASVNTADDEDPLEAYMVVQGDDPEETVDTLEIDTTNLKSAETDEILEVEEGNYKVSYSSLNGEVTGGLEAVDLAGNVTPTPEGSSKGSSSGCDTGAFGIAALLSVLVFARKKMF